MTGIIFLFTTSEWISLITAIGALITAIVTLFTIYEVKKQRQHSYQPDLDITNFDFNVYRCDEDENEKEPYGTIYLHYSKEDLSKQDKILGYNELLLDVSNTGFGAAKEVTWKWTFDIEAAKGIIGLSNKKFKYNPEEGELAIKVPKLDVDWFYHLFEENQSDYFNFI